MMNMCRACVTSDMSEEFGMATTIMRDESDRCSAAAHRALSREVMLTQYREVAFGRGHGRSCTVIDGENGMTFWDCCTTMRSLYQHHLAAQHRSWNWGPVTRR